MIFEEIEYTEITDYENYYISRCAKVLSTKGRKPRILKPRTIKIGYKIVSLYSNGKEKNMTVHRIVAKTFLQDYTEDLDVDHKDNDKANNNLTNLRMATKSENQRNRLKAVGVYKLFVKRYGTYRYETQWIDDIDKRHTKSFAVNKYGEELAKQKATEFRQEMVTKYYNRPQLF
tara:strand:- start:343 stop:864 length:522 start_codon:yes stop_codon:yes gene_type:complete